MLAGTLVSNATSAVRAMSPGARRDVVMGFMMFSAGWFRGCRPAGVNLPVATQEWLRGAFAPREAAARRDDRLDLRAHGLRADRPARQFGPHATAAARRPFLR